MGSEVWPEERRLRALVQRRHVLDDVLGNHWRWRHLRWK
jgi:hypothetical protein